MALKDSELAQLVEKATTRPRLRKRLQAYVRHVSRVRTLQRVLDPADTAAVGNPTSGNAETYQLEIARREGEIAKLERALKAALAPKEA